MPDDIYTALTRTALLLERDVFGPGAEHRAIIDGLRATTIRIIAGRRNIDTLAGQTALVTLYGQLAMMGLQIDLDVPDVPLVAEQPPLRGDQLLTGLLDYADDLMPGGSSRPSGTAAVTFALGDTPAPADAVRVSGTGWRADVGRRAASVTWRGDDPVGAMAAAAAAAADGLRAALPQIAQRLDCAAPSAASWRLLPERHVNLDLTDYWVRGPVPLGDVDVISGGAITNAALYALLRMPQTTAKVRIIEPELLNLSNLNRYALARRSWIDTAKTTVPGRRRPHPIPLARPSRSTPQLDRDRRQLTRLRPRLRQSKRSRLRRLRPSQGRRRGWTHPDDLLRLLLGWPDPGPRPHVQQPRGSAHSHPVNPGLAPRTAQPPRPSPLHAGARPGLPPPLPDVTARTSSRVTQRERGAAGRMAD